MGRGARRLLLLVCLQAAGGTPDPPDLASLLQDFVPSAAPGDTEVFWPVLRWGGAPRKRREAAGAPSSLHRPVEVRFRALNRDFHFSLTRRDPALTARSLVLVRGENSTEVVQPRDGQADCLYWGTSLGGGRDERVALNFCGGFRGVLTSATEYFVINPLPGKQRVSRSAGEEADGRRGPHVIFRRPRWRKSCPHNGDHGGRLDTSPLLLQQDNFIQDFGPKARGYFPALEEEEMRGREGMDGKKLYVELAIFVDRDLRKYMAENFPEDTDEHVVQVVLAMINAVQLLYSDSSLGVRVEFLIKRLEILQTDPRSLARSYNIDRYLASFCKWQESENTADDSDPLHWDHAVILTGLDVHVVDRDKKVSAQVVGLAPVAGMCRPATSCTVNEGRHFESVYVMAHEIGHNLGMRHDGRAAGNSCGPGSHIMSPTLGSGKITWSDCSAAYLRRFLRSEQASCLADPGGAEIHHVERPPRLPGERFPADTQCRLRYGPESYHSPQQPLPDLCRDLHCRREHYTWTSHPALEGTGCGAGRWCRRGACLARPKQGGGSRPGGQGKAPAGWTEWSSGGCVSPCLYSVQGSLAAGSTGLVRRSRQCRGPHGSCPGPSDTFATCNSVRDCLAVGKRSVAEHAASTCQTASAREASLLPYGPTSSLLRAGDGAAACAVTCFTADSRQVPRGAFPDGTVCQLDSGTSRRSFCVEGECQAFSCAAGSPHRLHAALCRAGHSLASPGQEAGDRLAAGWTKWRPGTKCSFSCLVPARGLQMVTRRCLAARCQGLASTLQVCEDSSARCRQLMTPFQYASQTCDNFQIPKLSGIGMQLTSTTGDPDRACRVACQDSSISYRFYMVTGEKGWFPYGTDCSGAGVREAYCVKGRCLEFGSDGTPLYVPEEAGGEGHTLFKRSLIFNSTSRVAGSIDQEYLQQIVRDFNRSLTVGSEGDEFTVNFENPVDVAELPDFEQDLAGDTALGDLETNDDFPADVSIIYGGEPNGAGGAGPAFGAGLLAALSFAVFR